VCETEEFFFFFFFKKRKKEAMSRNLNLCNGNTILRVKIV
jgi:hypothetical protein